MSTSNRTPSSDRTDWKTDPRVWKFGFRAIIALWLASFGVTAGFYTRISILILAGGALIVAIAIFWSSLQTLFGETRLAGADAYALGAPQAEEEQKRAVLRALKDLEFERSVGKISEADYQALTAKYRAEGKRLLRVLDEGAETHRVHVEDLVEKRFRREGLIKDDGTYREPPPEPAARTEPAERRKKGKKRSLPEAHTPDKRICQACQTPNDVDAVFCKKCGARQLPEPLAGDDEPEA